MRSQLHIHFLSLYAKSHNLCRTLHIQELFIVKKLVNPPRIYVIFELLSRVNKDKNRFSPKKDFFSVCVPFYLLPSLDKSRHVSGCLTYYFIYLLFYFHLYTLHYIFTLSHKMDSFSLLWDCNVNKGKLNRNVLAILQCSCVTFTCFLISACARVCAWGCFCVSSYVDTFLITGAFNTWIERQAQRDCTCKKRTKMKTARERRADADHVDVSFGNSRWTKYTKTPFIFFICKPSIFINIPQKATKRLKSY